MYYSKSPLSQKNVHAPCEAVVLLKENVQDWSKYLLLKENYLSSSGWKKKKVIQVKPKENEKQKIRDPTYDTNATFSTQTL